MITESTVIAQVNISQDDVVTSASMGFAENTVVSQSGIVAESQMVADDAVLVSGQQPVTVAETVVADSTAAVADGGDLLPPDGNTGAESNVVYVTPEGNVIIDGNIIPGSRITPDGQLIIDGNTVGGDGILSSEMQGNRTVNESTTVTGSSVTTEGNIVVDNTVEGTITADSTIMPGTSTMMTPEGNIVTEGGNAEAGSGLTLGATFVVEIPTEQQVVIINQEGIDIGMEGMSLVIYDQNTGEQLRPDQISEEQLLSILSQSMPLVEVPELPAVLFNGQGMLDVPAPQGVNAGEPQYHVIDGQQYQLIDRQYHLVTGDPQYQAGVVAGADQSEISTQYATVADDPGVVVPQYQATGGQQVDTQFQAGGEVQYQAADVQTQVAVVTDVQHDTVVMHQEKEVDAIPEEHLELMAEDSAVLMGDQTTDTAPTNDTQTQMQKRQSNVKSSIKPSRAIEGSTREGCYTG